MCIRDRLVSRRLGQLPVVRIPVHAVVADLGRVGSVHRVHDHVHTVAPVSYTHLTNVDDLVKMQREQSVTYESLPGFVAKYRIEKLDSGMELTLLSANRRFMEYFGGNNNRAADSLYNRNVQENMEMIERQKSRIRAGEPLHFTMHVKSRDGQALWLQVNATCVDWQEGCPVYLVIFIDITDVTELREMQRKLIAQTEALKDALSVAEQANRAKSDFLSRMSHEIRTPCLLYTSRCV